MNKPKLLVTGFDPFGGESINPSWEAVRRLRAEVIGASLSILELPTVFSVGADKLIEAVKQENPDMTVCVGQAGGRAFITPEKLAINVRSARIPDNADNQPKEEAVVKDAPLALSTSWELSDIIAPMNLEKERFAVSYHAGTFVCNDVYYRLLNEIRENRPQMRGLFVHVPFLPEQAGERYPSMTLDEITVGLEDLFSALVKRYEMTKARDPLC